MTFPGPAYPIFLLQSLPSLAWFNQRKLVCWPAWQGQVRSPVTSQKNQKTKNKKTTFHSSVFYTSNPVVALEITLSLSPAGILRRVMEKSLHPQPHPFLPEAYLSPTLAPDPSHTGPTKPSAQTTPLHSPHCTHTQPLRTGRAPARFPRAQVSDTLEGPRVPSPCSASGSDIPEAEASPIPALSPWVSHFRQPRPP